MTIVHVALPVPKRQTFDYLVEGDAPEAGCRVVVPFGNRTMLGVALGDPVGPVSPGEHKLKRLEKQLDTEPLFSPPLLKLCLWLSRYYQHPVGDVLQTAMPAALRKGEDSEPKPLTWLAAPDKDIDTSALSRAPKQKQLLERIITQDMLLSDARLTYSDAVINALVEKDLLRKTLKRNTPQTDWHESVKPADKPKANVQQALAITTICSKLNEYSCTLLEGVTGSGKTEVYLQAIEEVLMAGKQVLVLVPEIGLTPQTVSRFERRFNIPVGVLHSGLTDNERLAVWQQARSGEVGIVIGTRSAIFTPLAQPGMIIVDEEHDNSYKQQDGLRYHARDLAVMRAKEERVPLVLGSATPSLESLNNGLSARYQHVQLHQRAGSAVLTRQQLMDIRSQPVVGGIAVGMLDRIRQHLSQGNQVMLFVNRRGFAPALLCHSCGHVEECHRCNKPFTLHKQLNKLQCHHCGAIRKIVHACSQCGANLETQGVGTEQLEEKLKATFPEYSSVRIDSDTVRGKTKLQSMLDAINRNEHQILIGTQILSKGHHFPNVTLVVILDADGALYSADFRAAEHLAQLITQLAGRAGRAEKAGEMWLQTHHPEHPLLQDLVNNGYNHFARYALVERQHAGLPPNRYQALFRAEAVDPRLVHQFLMQVFTLFEGHVHVERLGPLPALMEKRQGRFRMQLLLQASARPALQQALSQRMIEVENLPQARKVRWSIDVDPQDFL